MFIFRDSLWSRIHKFIYENVSAGLGQWVYKYICVILHDWLINWCLTPTLAVFQLYTCHNTWDIFDNVSLWMLLHWQRNHVQSDLNRIPLLLPSPLLICRDVGEIRILTPLYWYVSAWDICRNPMTKRVIIVFTISLYRGIFMK